MVLRTMSSLSLVLRECCLSSPADLGSGLGEVLEFKATGAMMLIVTFWGTSLGSV